MLLFIAFPSYRRSAMYFYTGDMFRLKNQEQHLRLRVGWSPRTYADHKHIGYDNDLGRGIATDIAAKKKNHWSCKSGKTVDEIPRATPTKSTVLSKYLVAAPYTPADRN